jgi:hypothetical protein
MLDLMKPERPGGRLLGLRRQAWRHEAGGEGTRTRQHDRNLERSAGRRLGWSAGYRQPAQVPMARETAISAASTASLIVDIFKTS